MGRYCITCGKELNDNMKYCPQCGKKIPDIDIICSVCGSKLNTGAAFCRKCGAKQTVSAAKFDDAEKACPLPEDTSQKIKYKEAANIYRPQAENLQTAAGLSQTKAKHNTPIIRIIGLIIAVSFLMFVGIYFFNKMNAGRLTGTLIKDGIMRDEGITISASNVKDKEMSLKQSKAADAEYGEGLVGSLYEVQFKNLPDDAVDIEITLPEYDGGTYMLGVASMFEDGSGKLQSVYDFIDAKVDNGVLKASIVPADILIGEIKNKAGDTGKRTSISQIKTEVGVFSRTVYDSGGESHFRVTLSRKPDIKTERYDSKMGKMITVVPETGNDNKNIYLTDDDVVMFINMMEETYDSFIMEHGYQYTHRSKYPIDIHIQKIDWFEQTTDGCFNGKALVDDCSISINTELFRGGYNANPQKIRSSFVHEFFHFVQYNYTVIDDLCKWLDEATAMYYESKATTLSLDATALDDNWQKPFNGFFPEKDSANDGYGRLAVVQYLQEYYGQDTIRKIYENGPALRGASSGLKKWHETINGVIGDEPQKYIGKFFADYITGKNGVMKACDYLALYNTVVLNENSIENASAIAVKMDISFPEFTSELSDKIVEEGSYKLGSVSVTVPAYGARIIAINASPSAATLKEYPDSAELNFIFDMEGETYIIDTSGQGDYWSGGDITNIKESFNDKKSKYMAVVVNTTNTQQTYRVLAELYSDPISAKPCKAIKLYNQYYDFTEMVDSSYPSYWIDYAFYYAGKIECLTNSENLTINIPGCSGTGKGYDGTQEYNISSFTLTGKWKDFGYISHAEFDDAAVTVNYTDMYEEYDGTTSVYKHNVQMTLCNVKLFYDNYNNEVSIEYDLKYVLDGTGGEHFETSNSSSFIPSK